MCLPIRRSCLYAILLLFIASPWMTNYSTIRILPIASAAFHGVVSKRNLVRQYATVPLRRVSCTIFERKVDSDDQLRTVSADIDYSDHNIERRKAFVLGSLLITNSILSYNNNNNNIANAITMEYPLELRAPTNIDDVRNADNRRIRKINEINQQQMDQRTKSSSLLNHILSSITWGMALWLLSGSRSNPITTPLANIIYDAKNEKWLQDRNDGLFSNLPWEYFIILGIVFIGFGYGTDQFVNAISDGDATISLQLAGVSLIGGASLELGRISSGQKKQTRDESDRSIQLEIEFNDFAANRLQAGGNCHRSEVVQAFRRYYSKYRQADNKEYPLSDLEIEQLLRAYCRTKKGLEMSPAGFYNGIQVSTNADVFVKK